MKATHPPAILVLAGEEWRYWCRSRLALAVSLLFLLLLVAVSTLTAVQMTAENAHRVQHQRESEQQFLAQPDRHPHRMVHYGHYVFRPPAPLAIFDPGLDAVTGQAMFLEGHRQNSATFSAAAGSAAMTGIAQLTPALLYQLFAPLLLILLGHGALVREREAGTLSPLLAQGLSDRALLAGKALALLGVCLLLLIPLIASALGAVVRGESMLAAMALVGVYGLYLLGWAGLTLLASFVLRQRSTVLAVLAALWLVLTLVLPAMAVNISARAVPLAGKIETELAMLAEKRDLSDGHRLHGAAAEQLRADLFQQYGVQRLEDLPVNIRGLFAQQAEQALTASMNKYAEKRMQKETRQAQWMATQGWFAPPLALAIASRRIAGTDLAHHHRFLRQAEALRYEFVQGLNRVHAEQLPYIDDINRNRDAAAYDRTRMAASNWRLLDSFALDRADAATRLARAAAPVASLAAWLGLLGILLFWVGGRVRL